MIAVPLKPRRPAMTPAQFKRLLRDAGLTLTQAAAVLSVARVTTWRWATGVTPIAASTAKFIRAVIRPPTT